MIAFVLAASVCFLFLMSGLDLVQSFFRGWTPDLVLDAVARLSFLTNFRAVAQGVIDLRNVVFFGSLIGVSLFINAAVIELKKGA